MAEDLASPRVGGKREDPLTGQSNGGRPSNAEANAKAPLLKGQQLMNGFFQKSSQAAREAALQKRQKVDDTVLFRKVTGPEKQQQAQDGRRQS